MTPGFLFVPLGSLPLGEGLGQSYYIIILSELKDSMVSQLQFVKT